MDWRKKIEGSWFPAIATLIFYGVSRQFEGIGSLVSSSYPGMMTWLVISGGMGLALWYVLLSRLGVATGNSD